jgi:hypothetical protein
MGTPDSFQVRITGKIPAGYMIVQTPKSLKFRKIFNPLDGSYVHVFTMNVSYIVDFVFG